MKKMMLILTILVLLLSFGQLDGKENPIFQDVTGDGIPEKIYKEFLPGHGITGNMFFRLIIKEKTAHGWQNIFPGECLIENATDKFKINLTIISTSSGGYLIDKYSQEYPGQQILIYSPYQHVYKWENETTYFEAYFFKKEPRDKKFVLYRKDITDGKYQEGPRLASQLKKEFQQETKFSKAYKVVTNFWQALKKGEQSKIYSFLYYDNRHSFSLLEESVIFCQKNKQLLQALNFFFYSFNGEVALEEKENAVLRYCFADVKKKYKILIWIDAATLKIWSIYGEKNGEPFF